MGAPRTRCAPGEGPLWCVLLGGVDAREYGLMMLSAAARYGMLKEVEREEPPVRSDPDNG